MQALGVPERGEFKDRPLFTIYIAKDLWIIHTNLDKKDKKQKKTNRSKSDFWAQQCSLLIHKTASPWSRSVKWALGFK